MHQKKFRREYRQFIVEGEKLCDEFIHSNFNVRQIYLLDSKRVKYEVLLSKISKKIDIVEVRPDDLERMSTMSTAPDVLLLVEMPAESSVSEAEFNYSTDITLVLDGLKDPGNMGTIIRIADWYGIKNIVCSADCVELYNPKVVQSTMGSILRLSVFYTDLENYFADLKEVNIYGALLEGQNIYRLDGKINGLLMMGSESHGISESLKKYITHPITIPSWGGAESLNVAVATGILCSEARRREY